MLGLSMESQILWVWLASLGLGASALVLGVLGLLVQRESCRRLRAICAVVLVALLALLVEDVVSGLPIEQQSPYRLGLHLVSFGGLWLAARAAYRLGPRLRKSAEVASLLIVGVMATSWLVPRGLDHPGLHAPYDLAAGDAHLRATRFGEDVVQSGPPDASYNCHGWTFAAGCRALDASAVADILQEDGWQQVQHPMPDDVVVYQDEARGLIHSGRVKSIEPGGEVLVESKWGELGRYVHPVTLQAFPAEHSYYRQTGRRMAE